MIDEVVLMCGPDRESMTVCVDYIHIGCGALHWMVGNYREQDTTTLT